MKTIEEKSIEYADRMQFLSSHKYDHKSCQNGYIQGFIASQQFVNSGVELPELNVNVLCKVINCCFCDEYVVGYLTNSATYGLVWIIAGHHCTHHKNMSENCVIGWRPINYT